MADFQLKMFTNLRGGVEISIKKENESKHMAQKLTTTMKNLLDIIRYSLKGFLRSSVVIHW